MRRILVLGYYGFGNFGDELILTALQEELSEVDCDAVFAVKRPEQYENPLCARHVLVDRCNRAYMRSAFRSCDAVMLGGGGLVQDVTSWHNSLYYLGIPLAGDLCGKTLIAYAQGVGPVQRVFTSHLVRTVFGRMSLIDVRDTESRDLLRACGLRNSEIHVSCDLGLTYLAALNVPVSRDTHREPEVLACINPRFGWSAEQTAVFLDCLASHYDARIELVVLFPAADEGFTREVQARLLSPAELILTPAPLELVRRCCRATLTVAGRYHMAIVGAATGSPLVGLAYDQKITHLATAFGFRVIYHDTAAETAARSVLLGQSALPSMFETPDLTSFRRDRIERLRRTLSRSTI